ncbi:MAG: Fe-S cluster assembly protein SufD [Cyclobacteriaceae bacterium]
MDSKFKNILDQDLVAKAEQFEASLNGSAISELKAVRAEALDFLKTNGFPGRKAEAYKYTNLSKEIAQNFDFLAKAKSPGLSTEEIKGLFNWEIEANHLVYVNGIYDAGLSEINSDESEIKISSFKELAENDPAKLKSLFGKYAKVSKDAFTALNTAFTNDGVLVEIPKNTELKLPVITYFICDASESENVSFPRTLYAICRNSKADFVHFTKSIGEQKTLKNQVDEIILEENAQGSLYKIQDDSDVSFSVGETKVYQPNNSRFSAITVTLNGAVIRNNLNIDVDGEGCEANMFGLYLTKGKTHVDNQTEVDHIKPNSVSNELYKGIMDDNSRGVFNGKIFVRQEAQKTNAFQSNNNVLLSDKATINTKPQLEIWADDVKCSHGCTTGQLDDEAIFYLRSRGIGEEKARAMILRAFAREVIDKIEYEGLKEYVEKEIAKRLEL